MYVPVIVLLIIKVEVDGNIVRSGVDKWKPLVVTVSVLKPHKYTNFPRMLLCILTDYLYCNKRVVIFVWYQGCSKQAI